MLMTIYECDSSFVCIYDIVIYILSLNITHITLDLQKNKKNKPLCIGVFLEYVVNTCDSWFILKVHPPRLVPLLWVLWIILSMLEG